MPPLKFTEVLTYSSEDPNHPVDNLLKSDTYLKWKSKPNNNEKQEHAILRLEKLSTIRSIDIGNENSAFVEVLVGREGTDYQVLLVASSFMSPLESRNSTTTNRVRMFGPDKLNKNIAEQKWDRVKIICTQPFSKNIQYGLTFVKIYGPEDKESSSNETKIGNFTLKDEDTDEISIGSFFANKQEKDSPSLTGSAAIRAASKASITPENNHATKRPADDSANATEVGFYQLMKKAKESPIPKSKEAKIKDEPTTPHHSKAENANDKTNKESSQQSKSKPNHSSKGESTVKMRKSRPFNQLMKDVVFVMSGYQNPERGKLRDSLTDMGAKYKSDWEKGCTHLICAFKNTPKYQAVKGKGKIVSAKWVQESFKKKIRLPWRRFSLERNRDEDESEEEVWATEICPDKIKEEKGTSEKASKLSCDTEPMDDSEDTDDEIQRALKESVSDAKSNETKETRNGNDKKTEKNCDSKQEGTNPVTNGKTEKDEDDYGGDTDVDEEEPVVSKKDTSALEVPPLKSFFKGKVFFFYGSIRDSKKKALYRYIVAFEGEVSEYMSEQVQFVLTDDHWDDHFDEALNDHPSIQFVKPQWIWKCVDKEKLVPPQPFLIVPKDDS